MSELDYTANLRLSVMTYLLKCRKFHAHEERDCNIQAYTDLYNVILCPIRSRKVSLIVWNLIIMRCHSTNNSNVRALILTLHFCLYRNFFPIYKLFPQLLSFKKVCQQIDTIVSKKTKRNSQHCYI